MNKGSGQINLEKSCPSGHSMPFMVCILALASATAAWALEQAPLNPEFLQYQEQIRTKTLTTRTADGHGLGYIPAPFKVPQAAASLQAPKGEVKALPSSYDLRDYNKVTPVKDQGWEGNCWAFATYGSMESCLLTAETRDFSENNMAYWHGFNYPYGAGGNHKMAIAYLSRWSGPVDETDDPYSNGTNSPANLPVRKHVQSAAFIPDRTSSADNDTIKQMIMTHGALYSTICWVQDPYFARYINSYYFPLPNRSANHAIAIIGWDDNYSRTQFTTTPPGDGAFLVRNSWGGGWGDKGCFWVSYYDTVIGKDNVLFYNAASTSNFSSVYQYDTLGLCTSYGYGNTTAWGANIFSGTQMGIYAVSFYALAAGTSYEIRIYSGVAAGRPTSGTLKTTMSGTTTYAGYYTVYLSTSASCYGTCSVVVKFTTPGNNQPVPVEERISGYSSAATASAGESYLSSDGVSWDEAKNPYNDRYFNICIKAFGQGGGGPPPPPPPPVTSGLPMLADYDGDGLADLAIYRTTDGTFRLLLSSLGYSYYCFSSIYGGQCIVQAGDFDGDRFADPAVVDPGSQFWRFYSSRNGYARYYINQEWYSSSATPVCGDFDGDRYTDPMAYVDSSGEWYILASRYNYKSYYHLTWGGSRYTPVCGDFDGDRYDDLMLYEEASGYWYILRSRYNYSQFAIWFGAPGYTPVTGDVDGDRYADLAVYNTTSGMWYALLSSTGYQNNVGLLWDGSAR